MGIEQIAAKRNRMIGQIAMARPRSRHRSLAVDEPDPREAMSTERERVDTEECQFSQRSRGERVTACLVPCDGSLLDERDVMSCFGQPGGDRGSGRTTADDEDVGVQGACRQPASAGEPGMASGPTGVISASPITGGVAEV